MPNRHFYYFIALGLFWGISPSLYKHLADIGMPWSHTMSFTGLGVGVAMYAIAGLKSGQWNPGSSLIRYGALCGLLMNMPFGINLFLANHVPPTELAIMITMSPFFNYLLALATGWENAALRRLLAIGFGFASTAILILSREGMISGSVSWWLISAVSIPLLYCVYNSYAARAWPKGADTLMAGAMESLWSGLIGLPFVVWSAALTGNTGPAWSHYAVLLAACLMWIVERIAYFKLISEKGAVYTVQATYISTPTAVVIAAVFFGGAGDSWLWLSLGLLMAALYLNNSGRAVTPSTATHPSA